MHFAIILGFLSLSSNAGVVSSKCLKPLQEILLARQKSSMSNLPSTATVPIECQYFTFKDLDPKLQEQVQIELKKILQYANGNTKLSEILGLMKISLTEAKKTPGGQCGEAFVAFQQLNTNLNRIEELFMKSDQSAYLRRCGEINACKRIVSQEICPKLVAQAIQKGPTPNLSECNYSYQEAEEPVKALATDFIRHWGEKITFSANTPLSEVFLIAKKKAIHIMEDNNCFSVMIHHLYIKHHPEP